MIECTEAGLVVSGLFRTFDLKSKILRLRKMPYPYLWFRQNEQTNSMRYFLELSYLGTPFFGWQRQPDQPTVQQALEQALTTLRREPVEVVGAGRTDTGVHAAYYVAHADFGQPVEDTGQLCYKLNRLLPDAIAVQAVTPVDATAHARFSATERAYRYYIEPRKNPFTHLTRWQYTVPLDVARMNDAAACLLEQQDFTTFAKLNSNNTTNRCSVRQAEWTVGTDGLLCFTIRADRFLRNMVRAIVGTLVDVGRGRYTAEEFREIVASRDLSRASTGAPAQGLFLYDVCYPADLFERSVRHPMSDSLFANL